MSHSELLEQAIEAQGGLERYRSADAIRTNLRCSGWALALKRQRGALADFTGTVSTRQPHVVMEPFGGPGLRGILEGEHVRIEDASGTVASRDNPRSLFASGRRQLWWDDLDILYFGAYALWGYMNAPFMFADPRFAVSETEPWQEGSERWRGLEVVFPSDVPAHSRVQRYYFDARGLLRRNDYTAEVFGNWAKAAHYCYDHKELGGIVVPTRRRAMPRRGNGRPLKAIALVSIAIDGVELE